MLLFRSKRGWFCCSNCWRIGASNPYEMTLSFCELLEELRFYLLFKDCCWDGTLSSFDASIMLSCCKPIELLDMAKLCSFCDCNCYGSLEISKFWSFATGSDWITRNMFVRNDFKFSSIIYSSIELSKKRMALSYIEMKYLLVREMTPISPTMLWNWFSSDFLLSRSKITL